MGDTTYKYTDKDFLSWFGHPISFVGPTRPKGRTCLIISKSLR